MEQSNFQKDGQELLDKITNFVPPNVATVERTEHNVGIRSVKGDWELSVWVSFYPVHFGTSTCCTTSDYARTLLMCAELVEEFNRKHESDVYDSLKDI